MCRPTASHTQLAAAMRDIRTFVDVGQQRIATRMGCSRSRLSHFETAADLPNQAAWQSWIHAIQQAGSAKQRDAGWQAALTAKLDHAERLHSQAVAETAVTRQERPIRHAASFSTPGPASVGLDPWTPLGSSGPCAEQDIGIDASALEAFRSADRQVGGGHLYPTVIAYLHSSIAPRLFGGLAQSHSSVVFTVGASLTEMAGWMAHDAGNDGLAWPHFRRARDLAIAGGDQALVAHIMASMSHLALHSGDPMTAIELCEQVHAAYAGTSMHPELEARLLAMQARGAAMLGRPAECGRLLLRAERTLDGQAAQQPSAWVSGFDHASLASEAARCLRSLGQLRGAQDQAEKILSLRLGTGTRARAFGQLMLASVLIEQGDLDQACAVATDAINTTNALASFQVVQQLNGLRLLLVPYRGNGNVATFLTYLDEVTTQRGWLIAWSRGSATSDTIGVKDQ